MVDPVSLGISLALSAANMALTATQKIEGPRLDSTKFMGGDYNAPLPMCWGKVRKVTPVFWAEDLREVKRRRKTKGGKYNEYTYYGSWAVALAGHEIEGVTRVWFDKHLVFDMTGAGPITPFDFGGGAKEHVAQNMVNAGVKSSPYFAIYLGTDTQDPDARMQATVDDKTGLTNACPAYRGTAYIVFKDVPLEKLGNRIPQVEVEFVTSTTGIIPTEAKTISYSPNPRFDLTFSSDYSRLAWLPTGSNSQYSNFEIWDTAARAPMIAGTIDTGGDWSPMQNTGTFGVFNDGSMIVVGNGSDSIYKVTPDGTTTLFLHPTGNEQEGTAVLADGAGTEHWGTYPYSIITPWWFDGVEYDLGWQSCLFFRDSYGNIWVVGRVPALFSTTNIVYVLRLVTVDNTPGYLDSFTLTMPVSGGPLARDLFAAASGDNFIVYWEGSNYLVDPKTGTILTSVAATAVGTSTARKTVWANIVPGSGTVWQGNSEYDLLTGTLIRTISAVPAGSGQNDSVYDPINHALIVRTGPLELTWYYLDRLDSDGVTLGEIEADVADMCDVLDYDFSAHTQIVEGWSATQGQASNILEPLHSAYDCTIRPHDFTLQGINYSGTSLGTLTTDRFVKADPRYAITIRQAAELPRAITVTFADIDADQQPNNARADRPLDATGARGEQTLDMGTWVTNVDTARDYVDRYFRRMWNERTGVSNALTAQRLTLEPGDCWTLNLDDETMIARLVRLTVKADDTLPCEWKYDHPSLAAVSGVSGATFDGRTPEVISVPLISKGIIIDGPYIHDSDAQTPPIIYALAGPYGAGSWPGAVIYEAIDGEYSEEVTSIPSSDRMTWGVVGTALAYTNPNVWDRGSTITVVMKAGSLTGTTEDAININGRLNLAAYGAPGRWEYIQFAGASLIGADTYEVSTLKRGRRGTEWAAELHQANDAFVLLDTASEATLGLSDVGTDLSFKAITSGRSEGGTFAVPVEPFTGASLKPYAPCQLQAVKEGNGDWTVTWVRRTRVGGAWTSGSTFPLAEASEEYSLTLGDGISSDTKTVSSTTTYLWTVAEQTTDTGAEVMAGDLVWAVAQVSDAVGDGFLAEATA